MRRLRLGRASAVARPNWPAEAGPHYWLSACSHPVVQQSPHCDNPTEGIWSKIKGSLGNFTTRSIDQLAATMKHLLKRVQSRPGLINGCIAETGINLGLQPAPT